MYSRWIKTSKYIISRATKPSRRVLIVNAAFDARCVVFIINLASAVGGFAFANGNGLQLGCTSFLKHYFNIAEIQALMLN